MAADSMNADGTPADTRSPGGVRLLAIAYLTLFVLLILAGIAIAVFGNSGGEAVVRVRIADNGPRPAKNASRVFTGVDAVIAQISGIALLRPTRRQIPAALD